MRCGFHDDEDSLYPMIGGGNQDFRRLDRQRAITPMDPARDLTQVDLPRFRRLQFDSLRLQFTDEAAGKDR